MAEPIKKKRGRPREDIYEKYVRGKEEIIAADCLNGADNAGLAKRLGCGKTTLGKLIRNYPDFKKLIKESKTDADLKVQSALYKRALGYEYEETTTKVTVNKDGEGTTTFVEKTKKHLAPDTAAAFIWLKNRMPEEWKDKQEINITSDPFTELLKAAGRRNANNNG